MGVFRNNRTELIMNLSWNSVNRERLLEQNVSDMRGACFDSWSGHCLLSLRFLHSFSLCLQENGGVLPYTRSFRFRALPSNFLLHANMLLSNAIKIRSLVIDYQKRVRNLRQISKQIHTRIRKHIEYKYGNIIRSSLEKSYCSAGVWPQICRFWSTWIHSHIKEVVYFRFVYYCAYVYIYIYIYIYIHM